MATSIDPLTWRTVGKALWDTSRSTSSNDDNPVQQARAARHLAAALGYPAGWKVVRTVERIARDDDEAKEAAALSVIVDRIYDPDETACWFHHAAAQAAAATWDVEEEEDDDDDKTNNNNNHPYGHWLPRIPRYVKGDLVQAWYDEQWWDARIVRRTGKEDAKTGWRYQVHYEADRSKQSGVPEEYLRPRPGVELGGAEADTGSAHKKTKVDPSVVAQEWGLPPGWQATPQGHSKRYRITDPAGNVYTSKAKALQAANRASGGMTPPTQPDPKDLPWRTTGHPLLGRAVVWTHDHAVTARRTVTVVQHGHVRQWRAATDVDRAGHPAYVSPTTGQPAALFDVVLDGDDPQHHPYPSYLVDAQYLEYEDVWPLLVDQTGLDPPVTGGGGAAATSDSAAAAP